MSYWELRHCIEWLIVELAVVAEIPMGEFRAELGLRPRPELDDWHEVQRRELAAEVAELSKTADELWKTRPRGSPRWPF